MGQAWPATTLSSIRSRATTGQKSTANAFVMWDISMIGWIGTASHVRWWTLNAKLVAMTQLGTPPTVLTVLTVLLIVLMRLRSINLPARCVGRDFSVREDLVLLARLWTLAAITAAQMVWIVMAVMRLKIISCNCSQMLLMKAAITPPMTPISPTVAVCCVASSNVLHVLPFQLASSVTTRIITS